jgi:hypothetical protein
VKEFVAWRRTRRSGILSHARRSRYRPTRDAAPDSRRRPAAELAAAHVLIREGEAEIINEACKPFLVRVLTP